MRRSDTLDPAVAAELEAIDAALAGEREDPDLALIAAEARTMAPRMSQAFADRLHAAVRGGFAPAGARAPRRPRLRVLAPALGVAATVLLALVVAVSVLDGSGEDDSAGSSSPTSGAATQAADTGQPGGGAQDSATLPPASAVGPAEARRRVHHGAQLTIATPLGRLEATSDAVGRTADRLGGYVERSQVSSGSGSAEATFELRIPAARLDEGLAALARLGHVRFRSRESEDITSRFVSARSRLADARAEREALLRALAGATTELQIESIQRRLAITRSRIAAARADLRNARRTAAYARVGVTLLGVEGDEGAGGGTDGDRWTPGRALEDALDVLTVAAGVLIVAIAALLPVALLALIAALAWRLRRRRRREHALKPDPGSV